jgi:hypothetical protein
MSDTKFTPGPWDIVHSNIHSNILDIDVVANHGSVDANSICRVHCMADARLIAHAPDLYSDLIDLIEAVELMPDASDPATDLYIVINVARVTLDRIREGRN